MKFGTDIDWHIMIPFFEGIFWVLGTDVHKNILISFLRVLKPTVIYNDILVSLIWSVVSTELETENAL